MAIIVNSEVLKILKKVKPVEREFTSQIWRTKWIIGNKIFIREYFPKINDEWILLQEK